MFQIYYKCDFCYIFIQSDGTRLISAEFTGICGDDKPCELLKFAARELDLYFAGRLQSFASPLLVQGSPFQNAVYQALREIPYGQTATYKDIARKVCLKNAINSGFGAAKNDKIFSENLKNLPIRAVGNANARNKLPIFIPCHRVVAANGLGGYSCGRDLSVNLDKKFYENFYKKLGKNLGNLNGNLSENSDINLRNLNKNSSIKPLDIKRFLLNLEGVDITKFG